VVLHFTGSIAALHGQVELMETCAVRAVTVSFLLGIVSEAGT